MTNPRELALNDLVKLYQLGINVPRSLTFTLTLNPIRTLNPILPLPLIETRINYRTH